MGATVEIGHTYSPDRLAALTIERQGDFYAPAVDRYFNDTPEAAKQRRIAEFFGPATTRVALIDDVAIRAHRSKSSDRTRYQYFMTLAEAGVAVGAHVAAKNIYRESNFEQPGRELVGQIQAMQLPVGYRLSQDGSKLIVGTGDTRRRIALQGFSGVDDPTYPSCEVLDLAWLQRRLTLEPEAITILPAHLQPQQERVRILADLVGVDPAVHTTVFY